jgi:hypothetical protein|tara:strand:+ start:576 stop:1187 length:612 start_codon:yes stop_codon:yes gene_type:complete
MSVHLKLMQARVDLLSESLSKSGKNKFAGYSYFELSDFLPKIQWIFFRIGLCGYVSFSKELATLTITDVHDQTEIVITSPMESANLKGVHPIQNLGAVETYNRRYLWMAALELVEFDALDASKPLEAKQPALIHSPNAGARENVTDDEMSELVELADVLKEAVTEDPAKARQIVISANLEEAQKLALWTLLDSKTRASLKKKD